MTTATLSPNVPQHTHLADPTHDVIAWLLGSSDVIVVTAAEPQPMAQTAAERPSSDSTGFGSATEHDMTPEFIAWVLGMGYAAGRLPEYNVGPSRRP